MPKPTRLYSIDSIQLALTKSMPPQLLVTAFGKAATTGWNDITLVPLEGELSPDGILDLEFVGTPPQEVFVPYLVPVVAHYVWREDVERVIGVTVHARHDTMTRLVAETPPLTTLALGEEGHPPPQRAEALHGGAAPMAQFGNAGGASPDSVPGVTQPITSHYVGEEGFPITSFIYGEEHLWPTTFHVGEEGSRPWGETPTFFPGENGPSNVIAEQGSSPLGEQSTPDPWGWVERGGINAFGMR